MIHLLELIQMKKKVEYFSKIKMPFMVLIMKDNLNILQIKDLKEAELVLNHHIMTQLLIHSYNHLILKTVMMVFFQFLFLFQKINIQIYYILIHKEEKETHLENSYYKKIEKLELYIITLKLNLHHYQTLNQSLIDQQKNYLKTQINLKPNYMILL